MKTQFYTLRFMPHVFTRWMLLSCLGISPWCLAVESPVPEKKPNWLWNVPQPRNLSDPGCEVNDVLVDCSSPMPRVLIALAKTYWNGPKIGQCIPGESQIVCLNADTGHALCPNIVLSESVRCFARGASANTPIWIEGSKPRSIDNVRIDGGKRYLISWNLESRKENWRTLIAEAAGEIDRPVIHENSILVAGQGIGLQCYGLSDGKIRWSLSYKGCASIIDVNDHLFYMLNGFRRLKARGNK